MMEKVTCPECGSEDVKVMRLPYGDEEYVSCNTCKKLSIKVKVILDDKNPS